MSEIAQHTPLEVLLVDDDGAMIITLGAILRRAIAPHRLYVAGAGHAAVRLVERHHATLSLVVLDIVMPDLSGITVAARIRRDWPHLRILPITAFPERAWLVEALGTLPAIKKSSEDQDIEQLFRDALTTPVEPPPDTAYCNYLITEAARLTDEPLAPVAEVVILAASLTVREGLQQLVSQAGGLVKATAEHAHDITPQNLLDGPYVVVCPLRDRKEAEILAQTLHGHVLIVLTNDDLPLNRKHALTVNAVHESYPADTLTQALALTRTGEPFHRVPDIIELNETERRILELTGQGYETHAIARALSMKEGSVRRVRSDLYTKIKVNNPAALALVASDVLRFRWVRTKVGPPLLEEAGTTESDR